MCLYSCCVDWVGQSLTLQLDVPPGMFPSSQLSHDITVSSFKGQTTGLVLCAWVSGSDAMQAERSTALLF